MGKDSKLKKLARTLLTTTCLTAAAGSAGASTFLETSLVSGDFSNTIGAADLLPSSTTQVQGALAGTDFDDFFHIPGFSVGGNYVLSIAFSPFNDSFALLDAGSNVLLSSNGGISNAVFAAPTADLFFHVSGESGTSYTLNVNTAAPEPGTLGLAGLALAGALTLRRKKN